MKYRTIVDLERQNECHQTTPLMMDFCLQLISVQPPGKCMVKLLIPLLLPVWDKYLHAPCCFNHHCVCTVGTFLHHTSILLSLLHHTSILLSPRNSVGGDIVMRPFLCGWVSGCMRASVRPRIRRALPCEHDTDYSFAWSLLNFTCYSPSWWEEEPIDFRSPGQRLRWNLALCLSNIVRTIEATFFAHSLSNFSCKLFMMRGGALLILGHWVKGQGSNLAVCLWNLVDIIQTSVFTQLLSNFTCCSW